MNEIAGLRSSNRFSPRAPTDFADPGQNVGDGLLLSVMMDTRARSGGHREEAAPDCRCDTERGCNRGAALGPWRLCRLLIELSRAHNADRRGKAHGVPDRFRFPMFDLSGGLFDDH